MTIAELRALLETLPPRFDATEVTVYNRTGLCHVLELDLDRRRLPADGATMFGFDDPMPLSEDRRARKLRINGGRRGHARLWHEPPPEWRLRGWWPPEAAEIGLDGRLTIGGVDAG